MGQAQEQPSMWMSLYEAEGFHKCWFCDTLSTGDSGTDAR